MLGLGAEALVSVPGGAALQAAVAPALCGRPRVDASTSSTRSHLGGIDSHMKFGAALPACAEGLGYPVGFASPDGLARIAEHAEALGFYAVMANDHLCTPRAIRDALERPPISTSRS